MGTYTEIGHSKNVAAFEDLLAYCQAHATTYNPSNPAITLAALQAKQAASTAALQAVQTAKITLDNATNTREIAFKDLKKLSTRIVNALVAVAPAKQTIDDARTINNKLQGRRAGPRKKPSPKDAETPADPQVPADTSISVSQQSFSSQLEYFSRLIETVSLEPLYAPNETELSVTGLNTLLTQMQTSNTAVITATTAFGNARIARNQQLYDGATGLVQVAREVKGYIKSIFGASSAQYKQVSKIKFRTIQR